MPHPIPFPGKSRAAAEPSPREFALSAVPRIARICALGLGLDELLGEVCREVLALCRAERACLVVLSEEAARERVHSFAVQGGGPDPREAFRPGAVRDELFDRLRAEGTLRVPDLEQCPPDGPLRRLYDGHPARSALLLPLKFATRLLGVLALHNDSAPRSWSEEESRVLEEVVAPVLAASLERRRMEERLRASEERYRFLADNALDFISLHDRSGRYLYASPAARRMLGYRPEEMMGVPAVAFVHPGDRPRFLEENGLLAAGEVPSVILQYRLRRKAGSYAEVETISSEVPGARGGAGQVLRVTRDITERKQMERRFFESQKLETIGMLAGGVAHEFNNLLLGISGAVEMLKALLPERGEAPTYLAMIERSGNRAVELTRQLLAYARRGIYRPEVVSLNKAVSQDLPVLKAALTSTVDLRLDLAGEDPPVRADLTQLKQVLMSLCLNAAEAMPGGGVLTIRTRVESAPPDEERAVLEVSDTGCGMDEGTLSRIFEPFFSTKFLGRGMGLAAVRGIVENHRGDIGVFSELGKGTTFSVRFPMAGGTPSDEGTADAVSLAGPGTVLIADDEDDVRSVVRSMLESYGFTVLEARDGREAVDRFRERGEEIDLVLLDLMMPGMTGEEAFAEIRRIRPGVQAILASGYDESGRVREIVAGGFAGFLQKPFRRRELGQKVGEALGRLSRARKEP